ncbi:MAG: hypothetical protein J5I92_17275 [Thiogranum sp.]|nr:hypothetical protein [Thiogranum sp.]
MAGALAMLAAMLCGHAWALDVVTLQDLSQLARQGAPQLALQRMASEQPDAAQNLADWMIWEQERLQILRNQKMHAELVARVSALPQAVDDRFRRLALFFKADAQLQLGEAEPARATARDLLWFHSASAEPGELENWRRLVVRSYVLQDHNEDARLALLRYRQDFGAENPEWRWLSAKVMLLSGHADSALDLLREDNSVPGRFLGYVAQLKLAPDEAQVIEKAAVEQAGQIEQRTWQGAFWGLAARAAALQNKPFEQIRYLERALALPGDHELTHGVLQLDPDQLWETYLELGQKLGNQEQRLLGNDEDWYFPAIEAMEKEPLRARVLFAVLAEFGSDQQRRAVAHEYLVGMLDDLPDGKALVRRLYLDSARYSDIGKLPVVIRYRLIDEALESGDLATASRLMEGLAAPPAGSDRFEWDLRRARVTIFTGNVQSGVDLLETLLAEQDQNWDSQRVDRMLQVVFDLQTVERHQQALGLFEKLLDKPLEAQQHRELLFWMADSLQALEQFDQAAYLYLKSATVLDPLAMDPWAQTARYRAARALVEAGLLDDARQIYSSLLRATRDASRKAVLENELQRLHLVRAVRKSDG